MFKKLDWYITRKFVATFFFMVLIMVVVVVVIDIAEKVDDFMKNEVPLYDAVFRYYFNFIPWLANLLSPICVFLSVIFFTAKLTQDSEVIAMLSGGISFYRLLRPYLWTAVAFSGLSFYLNAYLVPESMARRMDFEYEYFEIKGNNMPVNIHKKVAPTMFAYIGRYDQWNMVAHQFSIERFDSTQKLVQKLNANRALWNDTTATWKLENVVVRTFGPSGEERVERHMAIADTLLPLTHEDVFQRKNFAESLPLGRLQAFIQQETERGSDILDELKMELYMRTAAPFASIVMTLIAFALSTKKRRGGIALQLGLGFILSFIYVFMLVVSRSVFGGLVPTWLAVWMPNLLFLGLGLFLLRVAPK